MKKESLKIVLLAALLMGVAFFSIPLNAGKAAIPALPASTFSEEPLQNAALQILENKCNVCHKKQNPFMLFKEKNMNKRARKIYQMVFVQKRMPKGTEIRLTPGEFATLEKWLNTQNIN